MDMRAPSGRVVPLRAPLRTTTVTPTAVRLYFMRNGKLGPVSRQVTSTTRGTLLGALNDGPTEEEKRLGFSVGEGDERTAEIVYTLSQFDPAKPIALAGKLNVGFHSRETQSFATVIFAKINGL